MVSVTPVTRRPPLSIPLKAEIYAEERFALDTRALASARRFLAKTLPQLADASLEAITMAVDEAMANVIDHAQAAPGSLIQLKLYAERDHIRLIMTNEGIPFSAADVPAVDLQAHLSAQRTSGLGLYLMNQLMDIVLIRTTREGHQELVMVKCLPESADG